MTSYPAGMKPRNSQDADADAAAPADWNTDANATDVTGWEADDIGDAGFNEDVPAIQLTVGMLQYYENTLNKKPGSRKKELTPLEECSIWVWTLKYAGIIPDAITAKPITPDIEVFKTLYAKAKLQHLNNKQQRKLEEVVEPSLSSYTRWPMPSVVPRHRSLRKRSARCRSNMR